MNYWDKNASYLLKIRKSIWHIPFFYFILHVFFQGIFCFFANLYKSVRTSVLYGFLILCYGSAQTSSLTEDIFSSHTPSKSSQTFLLPLLQIVFS